LLFGLDPEPEDAILLERAIGLSRGRSGNARGQITWPPQESFPSRPVTPAAIRLGVESADDQTFAFVGATFRTFLQLMPALLPIIFSADGSFAAFMEQATSLFDEIPPTALALFVAFTIANTERNKAREPLTDEIIAAVQPRDLLGEIAKTLDPSQRAELGRRLQARNKGPS
jgi:hypothetical protein